MYHLSRFILSFATAILLTVTSLPVYADTPVLKIQKELAKLEAESGGRLGISAMNTGNNQGIHYHAEERFPLQSTFKVIGVSAILKKSMTDSHLFQEKLTYTSQDLVNWAPITKQHVADGMTIEELCAAAIMYSDGAAINLLMKKLGGPQAVISYARSIGDNSFQVRDDNWTSTPQAMQISLQRLLLADDLALSQREQLQDWLKNNTTGKLRIRAGVPKGWVVGDKTGTGLEYGTTNDIAILWPPKCSPIVMAVYFTQSKKNAKPRPDVIAAATRLLVKEFARRDQCIKT